MRGIKKMSDADGLFGFYQRNYKVVDGDLVFSNGERICLNE